MRLRAQRLTYRTSSSSLFPQVDNFNSLLSCLIPTCVSGASQASPLGGSISHPGRAIPVTRIRQGHAQYPLAHKTTSERGTPSPPKIAGRYNLQNGRRTATPFGRGDGDDPRVSCRLAHATRTDIPPTTPRGRNGSASGTEENGYDAYRRRPKSVVDSPPRTVHLQQLTPREHQR